MELDNETIKKYFVEEVKIIQEVIKRMAANSFLMKGWAVTLVTATLLLKVAIDNKFAILIALIPLISFWILDAFFLQQERMYRKLYEWVVNNRLTEEGKGRNFFDMNISQFSNSVDNILKIMFSLTLSWFYLTSLLVITIYFCIISIQSSGCNN